MFAHTRMWLWAIYIFPWNNFSIEIVNASVYVDHFATAVAILQAWRKALTVIYGWSVGQVIDRK